MAKELTRSEGGHYLAKGREVFKAPTQNYYADGSTGWQMGFRVCECDEYVDGAAEHVAMALNEHEKLTPPKEAE